MVDTFLAILELSESRHGVSSVLHILESPAILRRFQLAEADAGNNSGLDRESSYSLGIDAAHREGFDHSRLFPE